MKIIYKYFLVFFLWIGQVHAIEKARCHFDKALIDQIPSTLTTSEVGRMLDNAYIIVGGRLSINHFSFSAVSPAFTWRTAEGDRSDSMNEKMFALFRSKGCTDIAPITSQPSGLTFPLRVIELFIDTPQIFKYSPVEFIAEEGVDISSAHKNGFLHRSEIDGIPFGATKIIVTNTCFGFEIICKKGLVATFSDISDDELRAIAMEEIVYRQARFRHD
jgi:hypothetical protein